MKKTKQIISIVLALVLCFALASCTANYSVDVSSNGKIAMVGKLTASQTELDKVLSYYSIANGFSGIIGSSSDTSTEDLEKAIKEFKAQSDKAGLTEIINGETYYSMTEKSTEVNTVKEWTEEANGLSELTTTDFWGYIDKGELRYIGSDEFDTIVKAGLEFQFLLNIKMPYKIDKTNGKKVDDYTVSFDIMNGDSILYLTTTASTATWTKSSNIRKALIEKAKKSYKLQKVTGVKVNYKSATTLKINWNTTYDYNATGYQIYRKIGSGKYKLIKTVTDEELKYDNDYNPYIFDKNVKSGKKYTYKVRTYCKTSDFTVYGPFSKVASKNTANLKAKPSISVKALDNSAKVTIKKAKYVSGYEIKYSKSAKFKGAKTVTTKSSVKTIKKLSDGKKYYVKVRKYCKGQGKKKIYSPYSKTVPVRVK